jgi:hypothetical protein
MPYEIVVHELAVKELASLRAFDRRRVLAEIRRELIDQPTVATRRRKCLMDLTSEYPRRAAGCAVQSLSFFLWHRDFRPITMAAKQVEEHRRQEDAEERHAQHAAEDGKAECPAHLAELG